MNSAYLRRLVIALLALGALFALWRFLPARPAFDADKVAQAETRMWQAYYSGDLMTLGRNLVDLLRGQFRIPKQDARQIAMLLARSAMRFRSGAGDTAVLPDLTEAYRRIRTATSASFDPDRVARADLAWWVARRTPGEDSSENVGKKIAEYYAALYGNKNAGFEKAGILRAQAAELRDSGRAAADWTKIEELLGQSYRSLVESL